MLYEFADDSSISSVPAPIVFIALLSVIATVVFLSIRRRKNNISLVLRHVRMDMHDPSGVFVEMAGRSSGLISWILTALRLLDETSLVVTERHISIKRCGLSGEEHDVIPLPSIASTRCAYKQPIWLLILGIFSIVVGIFEGLTVGDYRYELDPFFGENDPATVFICGGLIIGTALLITFILQKSLSIQLETDGGSKFLVIFRRTIIENVSVDMKMALQIIQIVNEKAATAQIQNLGVPLVDSESSAKHDKQSDALTKPANDDVSEMPMT